MNARARTGQDRRAGSFVHRALFYDGAEEFLAGTIPFIRAGLEAGEPVAVAVPGRNLERIRAELGGAARQVRLVDMKEAGRNPGRIIPSVLRAFADGHPDRHVRFIGEPIWPGRSNEEYPACVQHEALINLAFADRDVAILCPYDVNGLDATVRNDAAATHPTLVEAGGEGDSERYHPERMIDAYNLPLVEPDDAATLTFHAHDLTLVRAFAVYYGMFAGLTHRQVLDVELAVGELATNTIEHGGGEGRLAAWIADDRLVYQVRDRGRLCDPLAGRRPVAASATCGRGLLLVNGLADLVRVHTRPEATVVRIHFRVPVVA